MSTEQGSPSASRSEALAAFWQALEGAGDRSTAQRREVEPKLAQMLARGAGEFPQLALPEARYLAYLAERFTGGELLDYLGGLDAREMYLVCACGDGGVRAQRQFEADYFGEVRVGASRLRCSTEELDEIEHGVRVALFKAGADGRAVLVHKTARGHLRALIRLMALRAGISLRRKRGQALVGTDELLELAEGGDSPGSLVIKRELRVKFRVALDAAMERLEPRQRTLLRLHEVDGLGLAAIARMYQVDRSTITRWLAKARATIFVETRREVAERYGVERHHFDSFIDVIRSNFGASIHRALAE